MTQTTAHSADPPQPVAEPARDTWPRVLDAMHTAGACAGADAAGWWAQHTIGGRASGDTAARARIILAGLDDGDPAISDGLPDYALPHSDLPTAAEWYADTAPADAPAWDTLDEPARVEAIDAFRDGYHTALEDQAAAHCRLALPDDEPAAVCATQRHDPCRGHDGGQPS